ncbi:MAG: NifU family protein [Gemmatimonadota bacterium]
MLTITDTAQRKIVELMGKSEKPVKGLRVGARAVSPLKTDYKLAFIAEDGGLPDDTVLDYDGFQVYVDPNSLPNIGEAHIDYVDGLMGSGFKIDQPIKLPPGLEGPMVERVKRIIDERINPALAGHGGRVALIDLKGNTVYVQLEGGCQGCGHAHVTLKQGIEVMIKEAVPEIEAVLDVTDHGGGQNPYYQSSE